MIYLFLADGFEEIEALATVDVLRRADLEVKTVGVGSKRVTGSHHIVVEADLEQFEVLTDTMEMVILPGGMPGTLNLENSPVVTASLRYCADNGLPIGAICAAPSVLGHLGLLKGKKPCASPVLSRSWKALSWRRALCAGTACWSPEKAPELLWSSPWKSSGCSRARTPPKR